MSNRHRVTIEDLPPAFPGGKPMSVAVCLCTWRGNPVVARERAVKACNWHLMNINGPQGFVMVDTNDMGVAEDVARAIDEALQSAGYTGGALARNGMTGWGEIVQHAILDALKERL